MYNPQLETFLRVADAGSFNKAAEESFITPTAVIKQINLLEESLGVKLFDRSHRGLTLTKAGRSMYQDAKYIIQYCRDSVTRAKNAMQEDENIIRIGSSPMTPAQLLMELWSRVQTLHPDIKFQIVPFENTPENAREIVGIGQRPVPLCCFHSPSTGSKGQITDHRSLWRKSHADAPGLEPLCGSTPG